MKNSTRIALSLLLGVALFGAHSHAADEKPKQAKVITDADVDAAWRRRLPEIDLGDQLPLAEVAKNLAGRFPEVNFVVPVSAQDQTVPRLVLRNVALSEILKAIELASDGSIRGGAPTEPQGVDAATGLPVRLTSDNAQGNLVTFSIGPVPVPGSARQNPAVCRVFSLTPYLANRSEKDAQLAIKQLYDAFHLAWDMLQRYDRDVHEPSLTIHEGTRLLIAVGREKELSVIDSVIRQLQGGPGVKKVTPQVENESKPEPEKPKPASPAATRQ